MKTVKRKVNSNARITEKQKNEIQQLAEKNSRTYSDMFRQILSVGIATYKS